WPHLVRVGYRVPKQVRYLHPSGYRDVLVHNMAELERLSPQTDAARLAAGLGKKKRIELAKRAKELGIRILNGRNLLIGQSIKEGETEEKPSEKKSAGRERKSKS
ncbi:MAG: 50S ribosomal protein L32e, partial [Nitrososphaerota archaeon]|nr:50S ribosomal protein L32e [Nitrososphaerota archaeon]